MNTSSMRSTTNPFVEKMGRNHWRSRIQTTYRPRVLHALWPAVRQSQDSIPAKTTETRVSKSMLSNPKGSRSGPTSS